MGRRTALAVLIAVALALLVWLALREEPAPATPPRARTATPETQEPPHPVKDAPRPRAKADDAAATAHTPISAVPAEVAGPVLNGRVVDADGRPVAGARVVSHPDELSKPVAMSKAGAEASRTFVGTSDAEGRFVVPVDAKGVQLILTATADAGLGQAAAGPKDRDVEIKLVAWTTLGGRVTNTAGEPVPRARVTMHMLLDALTEEPSAVSDANGEYRIERVVTVGWGRNSAPVGRGMHGWVIAEAQGYAPLLVEPDAPWQGKPRADPTKLDFVLVRGMTVTGRVVDGDTKAGIEGATVIVWSVEGMGGFGSAAGISISNPWGQRTLGEVKSGADGAFRFENVPAQGPSGIASSNAGKRGQTLGHVAAWKDGYVYGGDEVPVSKDGTVFETTVELWPSATVTGRVVDAAGAPVEGAGVYAYVDDRRPALNGFAPSHADAAGITVKTGAGGRYRVPTFRASRAGPTKGKVSASLSGGGTYASSAPIEVTATAGETVEVADLVVDIGANARAVLVVTDERGEPVGGAILEATPFGGGQTRRTGLDGRAQWAMQGGRPQADGAAPAQSVIVRAKGFAPRQADFTPTRGTPVEVPVTLKAGARLRGRVQKADGTAAAKATVVVADGAKTFEDVFGDGSEAIQSRSMRLKGLVIYTYATTDAAGAFDAADLPEGPYLVVAQSPSRAPVGMNRMPKMLRDVRPGVLTGATDLVLTIPADDAPPTQPLELVVTDAAGAAVEKCWAQAVVGGVRMSAQTVTPTKLRFEALPVGRATIEVEAAGWAKATLRDVEIAAAAPPAPITVRMDRGITVRGVVRGESGALPEGAFLAIVPLEQGVPTGAARTELKKDGSFELSGFGAGRWRTVVGDPTARGDVGFVAGGDGVLVLAEDRREVVLDLVVVRAGALSMAVRDKRLPASPMSGGAGDPDKDRFGADARIEVVDAAGTVVWVQTPVFGDYSPAASLAPGDYVVRLRLAGEAPQEQRVTVKAGERSAARFPAK